MQIFPGSPIFNSLSLPNTAGTIGGVVLNSQGKRVLLTCFHCVFDQNLSWNDTAPNPDYGSCDCDLNSKKIGVMEQTLRDDRVDIALITPAFNQQPEEHIPVLGTTNGICYLTEENKGSVWLKKYGVATKDTYGRFDGFIPSFGALYHGETSYHYLHYLIKIVTTDGSAFSEKGDSGSFVLNDKNQVAGVIVMGNGRTSYAIQASIIETRLNLKFL
jgi:hypothetical protein